MKTIRTIGYEGANQTDFDQALENAGIDLVVDVRAVAVSRKAGFSKSALSSRLEASGICYLHLQALGDPKPGREAAKAGDMARFRAIFAAHMLTAAAKDALIYLLGLAEGRNIALLCYEAEPQGCHRAIVAAEVARISGARIDHLRVQSVIGATGERRRANHCSGEGVAAA